MINRLLLAIPLAAVPRFEELTSRMGEGFRGQRARLNSSEVWLSAAILAAIVGLWWLLARLVPSHLRRKPSNDPRKLFSGLCRVHRLNWSDRRLLSRVAKSQGLALPGLLFLEPERLSPDRLPAEFEPHRARLKSIACRLFAGLDESENRRAAGDAQTPPAHSHARDAVVAS